jgi:rare lipoprotein A (peptidoglycan hydrolase)
MGSEVAPQPDAAEKHAPASNPQQSTFDVDLTSSRDVKDVFNPLCEVGPSGKLPEISMQEINSLTSNNSSDLLGPAARRDGLTLPQTSIMDGDTVLADGRTKPELAKPGPTVGDVKPGQVDGDAEPELVKPGQVAGDVKPGQTVEAKPSLALDQNTLEAGKVGKREGYHQVASRLLGPGFNQTEIKEFQNALKDGWKSQPENAKAKHLNRGDELLTQKNMSSVLNSIKDEGLRGRIQERLMSGEAKPAADHARTNHRDATPQRHAKPPINDAKPPANDAKPPANDAKPPANDAKPPVNDGKPPETEVKPPLNDAKPPVNDGKPSSSNPWEITPGETRNLVNPEARSEVAPGDVPAAEIKPFPFKIVPQSPDSRTPVDQSQTIVKPEQWKLPGEGTPLDQVIKPNSEQWKLPDGLIDPFDRPAQKDVQTGRLKSAYDTRYEAGDQFKGLTSVYNTGRQTASGLPFDKNQMTVASKEFPFGTVLKITNPSNGREVRVVVNDHGPFAGDMVKRPDGTRTHARVLDLSQGAANAIGMGMTVKHLDVKVESIPEQGKWGNERRNIHGDYKRSVAAQINKLSGRRG